jgi:hypothetical protein
MADSTELVGPLLSLQGQVVALDLLTRALVTRWCLEKSDPVAFTEQLINQIVQGMDAVTTRPFNEADRLIWIAAEAALEGFRENLLLRLASIRERGTTGD